MSHVSEYNIFFPNMNHITSKVTEQNESNKQRRCNPRIKILKEKKLLFAFLWIHFCVAQSKVRIRAFDSAKIKRLMVIGIG